MMVAADSNTVCSSTRRASRETLRCTGPVGGYIAVVEGLGDREAGTARWIGAVGLGPDEIGRRTANGGIDIGILITGAGGDSDFRAIARQCLRHVFVSGPDTGALGVELGIVLIG